ncbi:MAG: hypothetical protein ACTHK7_16480 [Aureliella sp.]
MSRITAPTTTRGGAPSHAPPDMTFAPGKGLSQFLGWFSIGLGALELAAPDMMCNLVGVRRRGLVRLFGLREIATGIAVLSSGRPSLPMWGRVAGDALDLAALGEAMIDNDRDDRIRASRAAIAVAGVTALDVLAATELTVAGRMEG